MLCEKEINTNNQGMSLFVAIQQIFHHLRLNNQKKDYRLFKLLSLKNHSIKNFLPILHRF